MNHVIHQNFKLNSGSFSFLLILSDYQSLTYISFSSGLKTSSSNTQVKAEAEWIRLS